MTYWYEKYAVIAVGKWFEERGYEVRISVFGRVDDLVNKPLDGLPIPQISPDDFKDPQHRYNVYYDRPGTIDLVARKGEEIWVMQAKGITTRSNGPGMVAQAIGQEVMLMTGALDTAKYGLIFPDEKNFVRALKQIEKDNPVLMRDEWVLFLVSETGKVRRYTFMEFISDG